MKQKEIPIGIWQFKLDVRGLILGIFAIINNIESQGNL